jgi:hypothetical protein
MAMTVPAAASLAISGSTHTRPAQAAAFQQYAQQYDLQDRSKGIIGLGYKSKKSKSAKSQKKGTTGNAKSTESDPAK